MNIRESCLQTWTFIYKPGISLTKQDFHLQRGSLGLQRGFSGYYLPRMKSSSEKRLKCQYVAMTRARALICLAIPIDFVDEKMQMKLQQKGWNLKIV